MKLRLETVLSYVTGKTLADIGTDHAYVPIMACLRGLVERAIACDLRPGPLATARENIGEYHLEERIVTRLGDGLTPISPGEADCIVIAGMGGLRIAGILEEGLETARSAQRILLQPQHDLPLLRKQLHIMGFAITDETMLCEDGRFYTVMSVQPGNAEEQPNWTAMEYQWGRHILAKSDSVFDAYLQRESEKITGYIQKAAQPEELQQRQSQLAALIKQREGC